MSTHINGLAPQRMHWIGLLAAILVWVLGVTEVGGNVTIWFFKKDEMLASLLYAFAEGSPQLLDPFVEGALLDPDTWLSSTVTALIVFLDFLPVVLSAYALWLTGLFFLRLSRGETWTDRNIRVLWRVGVLCIVSPATYPLIETLQGLALSIDLPPGDRIFQFSIGLSSASAYEIIKGVLLCIFSIIMRDAKVLSDEQSQYI
ncbi:DUF2975 domain-containing protein [Pseudomonas koreensis]|uniref:DUF2975 domain-containing protein n=1 Tax=Pseudomonas moraviensis TaxID=321662 RepID=A0A2A2PR97_9PSED|nr:MULTISPECIES: DUF2975 domain-containing protein [Pseudomonas]AVX90240.1 DUF2975 domain-containing protein [Pseudomonas koreensis]KIK86927.1 hypothetical protein OC71_12045 [Pseudomonas sp. W15Feb9B]MBI6950722.1 DUF2975 domain-containing protein [Pseudomonas koreensis]MCU7217153.1 DUF2975 domain-containing protein [Pseudomonas sp. VE 196-7]NTZ93717.1 DUF2975 domain-containing protein [Pseudomonas koreensis]